MNDRPGHLLLYEPRLVGFHPFYLRLLCEDFLAGGYRLTLAVNGGERYRKRREEAIGHLDGQMETILLPERIRKGRQEKNWLARSLSRSGANRAFLVSVDEVASHTLRRAAFGLNPPRHLRGRMAGLYLRPRFFEPDRKRSFNDFLKLRGLRRLLDGGWFDALFLQDEFLLEPANRWCGREVFRFLPDPWIGDFSRSSLEARRAFGAPENAKVFLFYGTASPRKGLWVVTRALRELPAREPVFLLCAGDVAQDPAAAADLKELERAGRARVIARYVSQAEQDLLYCAADVVLLPYVGHYGSSGVLCHAAAAGKPVIASEGDLIRRRVTAHNLGWLFPGQDIEGLKQAMATAARLPEDRLRAFREAGLRYAQTCSREAFRKVLLDGLSQPRILAR